MRPEILFPLFAPVTNLPGVGPRLAKLIENCVGPQLVDMLWHLPAGIIDPAKVTRSALQNAASIASLLLTTEALIADLPEEEPAGGGGHDHGMGGMDF